MEEDSQEVMRVTRFVCIARTLIMANSKFEYVRQFEILDKCLPNCWMVVRVDGKNFHKFSDDHKFQKPNDPKALRVMNTAAATVMYDFRDIVIAYGQSDEYSFVFKKDTMLYSRRASKIMTNVVSKFSASYVFFWNKHFKDKEQHLHYPPAFDARVILYPSNKNLQDYLSWRQADCHINNLYNTAFWGLVSKKGMTPQESEARLRGSFSSDKNEILFSECNINYNNVPEFYRKGTVLTWGKYSYKINVKDPKLQTGVDDTKVKQTDRGSSKKHPNAAEKHPSDNKKLREADNRHLGIRTKRIVEYDHCDIIGDQFWEDNPDILDDAKSSDSARNKDGKQQNTVGILIDNIDDIEIPYPKRRLVSRIQPAIDAAGISGAKETTGTISKDECVNNR